MDKRKFFGSTKIRCMPFGVKPSRNRNIYITRNTPPFLRGPHLKIIFQNSCFSAKGNTNTIPIIYKRLICKDTLKYVYAYTLHPQNYRNLQLG